MNLTELALLSLVAAICSAAGQSLGGFSSRGGLVSIITGFAGAWTGLTVAGRFGLPEILTVHAGEKNFPLAWTIIGSLVFILLVNMIRKGLLSKKKEQ